MTKKNINKETIEVIFNEKKKQESNTMGFVMLFLLNGFVYYYYYMKWVRKKNSEQVVKELMDYPQDFIPIIFFTLLNILGIFLFVRWLI